MLDIVFDMFLQCFTCVYNSLNRVEIANGISLWTWILCNFVGFGILAMLLRNFGLNAVMERTDSSVKQIEKTKVARYKAKQKREKAAKEANNK